MTARESAVVKLPNHKYVAQPGAPMQPCAVCAVSWWKHDEKPASEPVHVSSALDDLFASWGQK